MHLIWKLFSYLLLGILVNWILRLFLILFIVLLVLLIIKIVENIFLVYLIATILRQYSQLISFRDILLPLLFNFGQYSVDKFKYLRILDFSIYEIQEMLIFYIV